MLAIKKAKLDDLSKIMTIIDGAKRQLAEYGSPQWQNGFGPNEESMKKAIEEGSCYIAFQKETIIAVACLMTGVDEVYTNIREGQWQEEFDDYLSIHRFAVAREMTGKGIGQSFLAELVKTAKNLGYCDIRIDTYPKNLGMIKIIEKCEFVYRGNVYFPIPDGERVAYQKIII